MTDKTETKTEAKAADVRTLQFIGPMKTLTKGRMKFMKGKLYDFDMNEEPEASAFETLRTSPRFREYKPKTAAAPKERASKTGLRMTLGRARSGEAQLDKMAEEARSGDDKRPKLPETFTSKKLAIDWAKKNLDLDLDKSRSLPELNRTVATEYGKKYAPPPAAEDEEHEEFDTGAGYNPPAGEEGVEV